MKPKINSLALLYGEKIDKSSGVAPDADIPLYAVRSGALYDNCRITVSLQTTKRRVLCFSASYTRITIEELKYLLVLAESFLDYCSKISSGLGLGRFRQLYRGKARIHIDECLA